MKNSMTQAMKNNFKNKMIEDHENSGDQIDLRHVERFFDDYVEEEMVELEWQCQKMVDALTGKKLSEHKQKLFNELDDSLRNGLFMDAANYFMIVAMMNKIESVG